MEKLKVAVGLWLAPHGHPGPPIAFREKHRGQSPGYYCAGTREVPSFASSTRTPVRPGLPHICVLKLSMLMKADALECDSTLTSPRWALTSHSINTEDTANCRMSSGRGTSDWVGYCHRQKEAQALAEAEFCPLPSLALDPVPSCITREFTTLNTADTPACSPALPVLGIWVARLMDGVRFTTGPKL
jgi:hypothetical protein